jgi:hypothetical protein
MVRARTKPDWFRLGIHPVSRRPPCCGEPVGGGCQPSVLMRMEGWSRGRSPPCRPGGIGFFGWLLSITPIWCCL